MIAGPGEMERNTCRVGDFGRSEASRALRRSGRRCGPGDNRLQHQTKVPSDFSLGFVFSKHFQGDGLHSILRRPFFHPREVPALSNKGIRALHAHEDSAGWSEFKRRLAAFSRVLPLRFVKCGEDTGVFRR